MSNDTKTLDQQVAERLGLHIGHYYVAGQIPLETIVDEDNVQRLLNGYWTKSLDRSSALWDEVEIVSLDEGARIHVTKGETDWYLRPPAGMTYEFNLSILAELLVENWLKVTADTQ